MELYSVYVHVHVHVYVFTCIIICLPSQCIPHIDAEVLAALVPKIVEILKKGVGLGTKVNCFLLCL